MLNSELDNNLIRCSRQFHRKKSVTPALFNCHLSCDDYPQVWEVCHYKQLFILINMFTMYRQEFARLELFKDLTLAHLELISSISESVLLAKERIIFEQGAPANHLFILQDGQVVIRYKPYDGPSLVVAHIATGGVFGWSAALHRDIYTSSAIALENSHAFRISGESLQSLCVQCPETGKILLDRLARVVSERLRSTHTEILGILSQGADNR